MQSLQRSAAPRAAHLGFTLLDIVLTLTLIAILTAVSIPRAANFIDSISVHGASSDAFAIFSSARSAAVSSAGQSTVDIDTANASMYVRVKSDTILRRNLGQIHEVKLSTSRPSITFSASGMGYGAGNLTLVIKRGKAVDSLFVSRLGRVRH